MSSPSSCIRCRQPLSVTSASGLCPTCQSVGDTPPDSRTQLYQPADNNTASFRPVDDAGVSTATLPIRPSAPGFPHAPPGFVLIRRLGGGGMGEVYLAEDTAAERQVAIKFLSAPNGFGAVSRFVTEIRALARLDHPNIVRVLSHDLFCAMPFFTMDYAPGGTLADRVFRDGPMNPTDAAKIIATVARAVHTAHGAEILHRDLKPSNVLLTEDGTPRVSDFGLAKRTDRDDGLTTRSGPLGTPGYMPPEQVSNRIAEIGPPSDVYGLGATLYNLLTGRAPFSGSEPELYTRIIRTPPERPRAIRRDIPIELEGIVLKCLEKRPADRYLTAEALATDLERFLSGDPPLAPPMTRGRRLQRWTRRHRWGLVALASALAIGIGLVIAGRASVEVSADPVKEARKEFAAGRPVTLVGDGKPRWHQWLVGNSPIDPDPPPGGGFSFSTTGAAMLALHPDPGIDRYTISLELCQIDTAGQVAGNANENTDYVGVFFCHQQVLIGEGVRLTYTPAICFSDRQVNKPRPASKHVMQWYDFTLFEAPLRWGTPLTFARAWAPLEPVAALPGPWRAIKIDVSPDGVTVHFPGKPHSYSRADLQRHLAGNTPELDRDAKAFLTNPPDLSGLVSPPTRGPLGILARGSRVGVKSFVVTPRTSTP